MADAGGKLSDVVAPETSSCQPGSVSKIGSRSVEGEIGRQLVQRVAGRRAVTHAYLDRVEARQHIEVSQGEAGQAVDAGRIAEDDAIEPAAAARPAGGRAVFVAALADVVAGLVQELGWEDAEPTRVVYAFATPITPSMSVGPMPVPMQAPPAVGCDEVTNG